MHRQFLLGDESPHAPYVNYLKNQPRGRIPDEWTAAGKGLLQNILNHERLFDDRTGAGLPPGGADLKDYQDTWIKKCKGEDTELARAAYFQFSSRDEDTLSEFLFAKCASVCASACSAWRDRLACWPICGQNCPI